MYQIKSLDLSQKGIHQCSALLMSSFTSASHSTANYLDWLYNQNPLGSALGFNAFSNEELAAHYATLPILAFLNGKKCQGLLSLNTATHPKHRRKNLFITLANATYEYAKEKGFEFVLGVANTNSTYGFTNRLGFQLVRSLEVKIGLGRLPIKKKKEPVEFERIWDTKLIEWRLGRPDASYVCVGNKESVEIQGGIGKIGIRTCLGNFDRSQFLHEIINGKRGVHSLKIWIGVDHHIDWRRSYYLNLPRRFWPSPLNLIFKDLQNPSRTLNSENIRVSAIDFDFF